MHSTQSFLFRALTLMLALALLLPCAGLADEERGAQFDAAYEALLTPAQAAIQDRSYTLHVGDSAYVPMLNAPIVPYDQRETANAPAVNGSFQSEDERIVTVDDSGLMMGIAAGSTTITYKTADGDHRFTVTVGDDMLPELVKNYIYILSREFYEVKRSRLPKYNKYAKWYYGRKNEVGWCSVFTIFCANAAGANPIKEKALDLANLPTVQFMREGQVGKQYDCFLAMERFVSVPKPGYLVIYADMSNGYRTIHIASVTEVVDNGDGTYIVTTIEGNMSNSIKSYSYLYDSKIDNHLVGVEKGLKLQNNMQELPKDQQTDPLVQYELHTDHWSVFGFCQTWK